MVSFIKKLKAAVPDEISPLSDPKIENDVLHAYDETVKSACDLLDSKSAYILLLSYDKKHVTVAASQGALKPDIAGKSLPVKSAGLEFILKLKSKKIVNTLKASDWNKYFTQPLIIAPFAFDTEKNGFLVVCNGASSDVYKDEELSVAGLIASHLEERLKNIRYEINKKGLEHLLVESKDELLTIMDGIKDGILLVDKDFTVRAMNKEQAKRSKVSTRSVIGRKCYEVIHDSKDACKYAECSIQNTLATKKVSKNTYTYARSDGEVESMELTAFPLFDDAGEIHQVIVVLRDMTKEKKMHHQLIQSEKLATLGMLSAKIGHEIRNPLTAILACAQFLSMKDKDNKSIKILISEASRIQSMVNDLMAISKPKKPTESLVFIEKVLEDVVEFLMNVTGQVKYQHLIKKFSDVPPVKGDEEQLKQVFTNLILNASQAMEESDNPKGELIIGTEYLDEKKQLVTYVTDCGSGIQKSDIKKIFDPFYTTKGEKGTGLGMAVVKEIVDSHGGSIEVESKHGVGTTIIVILPVSEEML